MRDEPGAPLYRDSWVVLFTTETGERVGIKSMTDGAEHEPRWETSRPMTAQEMLDTIMLAMTATTGRYVP